MSPSEVPARWSAPAKINLFLKVTGRRANGYHDLQTVFQFLDLRDRLWFEVLPEARFELVQSLPGVDDDAHLCLRAARALAAESGTRAGVRIGLEKRIPTGAGLGGGSSDAATTLSALDVLWQTNLGSSALASIALKLGADVPVFVAGRSAWGEGLGERLVPVRLPTPWYAVVHPGCHVATGDVFNDGRLTRNSRPIKIPDSLLGNNGVTTIEQLLGLAGNDCQAAVSRRYPLVADALAWLSRFGSARMTGTGAAVFAAFEHEADARAVIRQIPDGWWGTVARGVNESPLVRELRARSLVG